MQQAVRLFQANHVSLFGVGLVVILLSVSTATSITSNNDTIYCGPGGGGVIHMEGSPLGVPIATAWAKHYQMTCSNTSSNTNVTIVSSTSNLGAQHVCDGTVDVAISSRPLLSTTTSNNTYNNTCPMMSNASHNGGGGTVTTILVQLQIAMDAVVLVVARNGSAAYCLQQLFNNALTLDQLRLLYSSYSLAQLDHIPTMMPTLSTQAPSLSLSPSLVPPKPPSPKTTFMPTASPILLTSIPTFAPPVMPSASPVVMPIPTPSSPSSSRPTLHPVPKRPVTSKGGGGGGMKTPVVFQPFSAPPSIAPNGAPPTFAPVIIPTPTTLAPVLPTFAPVAAPNFQPVSAPHTFAPIAAIPTFAPVVPPSFAPIVAPTFAPIKAPTLAPIAKPVLQPTRRPSTARPTLPTRTLRTVNWTLTHNSRTRSSSNVVGTDSEYCNTIPVLVAGPPVTSETFQYFVQRILTDYDQGEDITSSYYSGESLNDILDYLQNNTNAIAFVSLADLAAYRNQFQAVNVQSNNGKSFAANAKTLLAGRYPLSFNLYMDVRSDIHPVVLSMLRPFLEFAYSQQGDADVTVAGLVPVSDVIQAQMLSRLDNTTTPTFNNATGGAMIVKR